MGECGGSLYESNRVEVHSMSCTAHCHCIKIKVGMVLPPLSVTSRGKKMGPGIKNNRQNNGRNIFAKSETSRRVLVRRKCTLN